MKLLKRINNSLSEIFIWPIQWPYEVFLEIYDKIRFYKFVNNENILKKLNEKNLSIDYFGNIFEVFEVPEEFREMELTFNSYCSNRVKEHYELFKKLGIEYDVGSPMITKPFKINQNIIQIVYSTKDYYIKPLNFLTYFLRFIIQVFCLYKLFFEFNLGIEIINFFNQFF
jgi:hypothetical protein